MRFKEFLSEKAVTKWSQESLDMKAAIDLLNKHCKNGLAAISKNGLLYRGFKHSDAVMVIDPSTGFRTSKDSNNLYQLMMDNSTALADYPSRSKSLICTSSLIEAASYGTPSVVIPFDGVEIVCTDNDDFFGTTIESDWVAGESVEDINDSIAGILYNSKFKHRGFQFTDIAAIDKHVSTHTGEFVDEWFEQYGEDDTDKFVSILEGDKPFTSLCSAIMTPKSLSIFKQPFGEPINKDVECWFSGKCVVIDGRVFAGILQALRQTKFKISHRIEREFTDTFHNAYDPTELDDYVVKYIETKV